METNFKEQRKEIERKMQEHEDRADGIGKYPEE